MHILRFHLLALAATIGALLLSACGSASPTQTSQMSKMDMPDFVQSAASSVQEAYQFAVSNPHALATVPCYCGCGGMGHKSNLDCYIKDTSSDGKIVFDVHAAYCGVCVDITKDVMRLRQEGKSPHEIRVYIGSHYSSIGPSTDTAMPAE
jgi:hypothetical protein